jgi:Ni/Co efflux regulator RcnB
MGEKIKSEVISRRRALSLLGLATALGLAVPSTMATVSDAEAEEPGAKTGKEHERHEHHKERRHERHEHRKERRHERHEHREERQEKE